jgi:hypothetical protein
MKFLRYLIFIPICFVVLGIIYWLFGLLLSWFIGLSTFWLIAILLFFGGAIWGLFKGLSGVLMGLTSKISPSFEFAFWTVLVLSAVNGIWTIVNACKRIWYVSYLQNLQLKKEALSYQPTAGATSL